MTRTPFRFRSLAMPAVAVVALLAAAGPPLRADSGRVFAIRGCRVLPVLGAPIEKGTLVLRGGLIEAVGPAEKIVVPPDAEIIEGAGLTAYPGFILAHSNIFIDLPRPEGEDRRFGGPPAAAPSAAGAAAAEDRFPPGPGLMAFDMLKPKKDTLELWQKAGVVAAVVAPARGYIQGQSVFLCLNGLDPAAMVIRNPAALHLNYVNDRGKYPESLMGTVALFRQDILDASWYGAAQAQYARTPLRMRRPAYAPALEALLPYARRDRPVVIQCNNFEDVKRALAFGAEMKLNVMITGANEAWRVADVLKAHPAPLLVSLDFRAPNSSFAAAQGEAARKKAEAEVYPANAAALAKAGVPFALTSLNVPDAPTFTKAIRAAIKAGLPKDKALEALTLQPARFLGVGDRMGALQPGRAADVVLSKGDIFDEGSTVLKVFADGILFEYEEKGR